MTADVGGSLSAAVTAYTGSSFADLRSLGCRVFSDRLTFRAAAGTTYWFQAAPLFGSRGLLRFALGGVLRFRLGRRRIRVLA